MEEESISKSQKKRDAATLQKLGVELVALPVTKLDCLPLTDNLRQALIAAKTIKSHGAMRRQAQLIGKLMRGADSEAIISAYEDIMAEGSARTAFFHEVESWRDQLINDGKDALTQFINAHPTCDIQTLRQLVKKAVEEKTHNKNVGASKTLFRFLRSCLE